MNEADIKHAKKVIHLLAEKLSIKDLKEQLGKVNKELEFYKDKYQFAEVVSKVIESELEKRSAQS